MVKQDVQFSIGWLWSLLRVLDLRLKKSLHAGERDSEANRERRAQYFKEIGSNARNA